MAKANWVKVNPASGSGNATVKVSSTSPNTGRSARSTKLTWTAANVDPIERTVNQAGKPTKDAFMFQNEAAADKNTTSVTLQGAANSKKLTFSVGSTGGGLILSVPTTYTANSVVTNNGAEISGDPGATASYSFHIIIQVPVNMELKEKTGQIIVTDEDNNTATCTIRSAAGDAYVTVEDKVIELNWEGSEESISVQSNTSWTIS